MMDRSTDEIKDTIEEISETADDRENTVKIYALHGAQPVNTADDGGTDGHTAKIIAFNAPEAPAEAAETEGEPDAAHPADSAPADAEEPADEPLPENVAVISRVKLERQIFEESNDFFDEAPRRVIGVISSKEIEEAEDYDVLDEAEYLAGEFETEPPEKDETIRGLIKSIAAKIKSFFVHLGYFITNLKHGIQRRRAAKKRQKAEAERMKRAAEQRRKRQDDMESRRDSNGLVQVRRRRERRDSDDNNR